MASLSACLNPGAPPLLCEQGSCEEVYEIDLRPEPDFELSPRTGWTQAHYEAVFGRLLLGFTDHLTESGARTNFDGNAALPSALEGVARMLPLIAAWLANPDRPTRVRVDGRLIDLVELGRNAVLVGTDPDHPDYWRPIPDGFAQPQVEAADVARFLVETRTVIWDQLTIEERDRIMQWLRPASMQLNSNWQMFLAARNEARLILGYDAPVDALLEQLDSVDADYLGDGWFGDGRHDRIDYYSGFVYHPELLFWAKEIGDDPARRGRIVRRARAFLAHLPYLYASDGALVAFGRSLSYRSAIFAPLVSALDMGISPLPAGQARRLMSGNLSWHMGGDVTSTDRMLGDDDVLTRGLIADEPRIRESYIRPGSQYFFARALGVLRLPDDHPFWTETEAPIPADDGAFVHTIPSVGFTLARPADDDNVVMLNAFASHTFDSNYSKYRKLDYASHFYFNSVAPDEFPIPYDAMVMPSALGNFNQRRSATTDSAAGPGFALSEYQIPPEDNPMFEDGNVVRTAQVWLGDSVARVSCLVPDIVDAPFVYEGSVPIAVDDTAVFDSDPDAPWSYLEGPQGAVQLVGVSGYTRTERQLGLEDLDDVNAVHGRAQYLSLSNDARLNTEACFASLMRMRRTGFDPRQTAARVVAAEQTEPRVWSLRFADAQVWISLETEPPVRVIDVRGRAIAGPVRHAVVFDDGTIAASGVTSIDGGAFAQFDTATDLRCDVSGCTLGGPGRIRARGPAAVAVNVDGTRSKLDVVAGMVVATQDDFRLHATAQELRTLTVEFEGP